MRFNAAKAKTSDVLLLYGTLLIVYGCNNRFVKQWQIPGFDILREIGGSCT